MGYIGGYGLLHPGSVGLSYSLLVPGGSLGINGYKNHWNFHWTTNAGGGGSTERISSPADVQRSIDEGVANNNSSSSIFVNIPESDALELLNLLSKKKHMEMLLYKTDYGYAYERTYSYEIHSYNKFFSKSYDNSYSLFSIEPQGFIMRKSNTYGSCNGYSLSYPEYNDYVYYNYPFFQRVRVREAWHTHPDNSGLSYGFDDVTELYKRIPFWALGWDGIVRGLFNVIPPVTITR